MWSPCNFIKAFQNGDLKLGLSNTTVYTLTLFCFVSKHNFVSNEHFMQCNDKHGAEAYIYVL